MIEYIYYITFTLYLVDPVDLNMYLIYFHIHQGSYLKMKSGVPMAFRASAKAQRENGGVVRMANISRPKLALMNCEVLNK